MWFVSLGECPFYSLIVEAELTDRAMMGVSLRAAKGQGEVAMAFTASRRCSEAGWREQSWSTSSWRCARRCAISADGGGRRRRLGPVGCGGVQMGMSRG